MNSWAYRVYRSANFNEPVYGGMVHAESMNDAIKLIIKRGSIRVYTTKDYFNPNNEQSNFYIEDVKVSMVIYVNPEDYKEE